MSAFWSRPSTSTSGRNTVWAVTSSAPVRDVGGAVTSAPRPHSPQRNSAAGRLAVPWMYWKCATSIRSLARQNGVTIGILSHGQAGKPQAQGQAGQTETESTGHVGTCGVGNVASLLDNANDSQLRSLTWRNCRLKPGKPGLAVKDQVKVPTYMSNIKHYGMHRHFTEASSVLMFGGEF